MPSGSPTGYLIMTIWVVFVAFTVLLVSAFSGFLIQRALPTNHRSPETVDAVRLVMTMLLTLSAVVLGLLTSSAKARYDGQTADLERYSVDLIELDQRLRQYGPDALQIRGLLRAYTAAAIADTWPGEAHPPGKYPLTSRTQPAAGLENVTLGDLLATIDRLIEELAPADAFHQQTAERLRNRVADTLQQRWRLLASAHSTISWPFLSVLMFWLVIIFLIFGLSSADNALVYTVFVLCALSVASSLYVILDFDAAQTGIIRAPSQSLREALSHMDRPSEPQSTAR
jgi:hypothetical protein